jgi:hypothetical protein
VLASSRNEGGAVVITLFFALDGLDAICLRLRSAFIAGE